MRISINEHIEGDQTIAGDPMATARAAGARAWDATDARLDRLRSRLDQPRRVLLRDFLIFEMKQVLDSFKGLIIAHIAVAAFILDMIRIRGRQSKAFYKVMDVGERLDHWLSLYGATRHAADDPEGLFGESREGSPTMLGQLERLVHRVVVGEDGALEGELYPRTRAAPASGTASPPGVSSPAGAAPAGAAGAPRGSAAPGPTPASATASTPGSTPGAGAGADAGSASVQAPGPARTSSFEAENYGRATEP